MYRELRILPEVSKENFNVHLTSIGSENNREMKKRKKKDFEFYDYKFFSHTFAFPRTKVSLKIISISKLQ